MRKARIYVLCLMMLLFCACESKEPAQEVTATKVVVDGIDITLGMTLDELFDIYEGKNMDLDYFDNTLLCPNVELSWEYETQGWDSLVLEQNASDVRYYVDTEGNLVEIDVFWTKGHNQEVMMPELLRVYGKDYVMTTIDYGGEMDAYRWDKEDGVSIVWTPEREEGEGLSLHMMYTDNLVSTEN